MLLDLIELLTKQELPPTSNYIIEEHDEYKASYSLPYSEYEPFGSYPASFALVH
jgi:hypothetical protein